MKIYDTEGFPNPLRVRIALAEKGATDKVVFVPRNKYYFYKMILMQK